MILRGWKEISNHLGFGIRTLQRWERQGLPVMRVGMGRRSPVIADSAQLDTWMLRGTGLPPGTPVDLLQNLEGARELRREVRQARTALHKRMVSLRKEMGELRTRKRFRR